MKEKRCPVCGNKKFNQQYEATHTHGKQTLSHGETFIYSRCSQCDSIVLQNVVFDKKYYQTYYDFSDVVPNKGILASLEKHVTHYSQQRKQAVLKKYAQVTNKKISLLDVGSGNGDFLYNLGSEYNAYGIELDKKEYAISRKKGVRVFNEDILTKDFKQQKFDIITMWHVVEHIPDPGKLFDKLRSLLTGDGILVIATPNTDSMGFKLAGTEWFHFDAPRHVILFNEKGIRALAHQHKFIVNKILCEQYEFPLDLFWSIKKSSKRSANLRLLSYPLLKSVSRETITCILSKQK